jgi:hypothetical protein
VSVFPTFSRDIEWEFSQSIEDSTIRTTAEAGYVHTPPKFTRDRKAWAGITVKYLTDADVVTLDAFVQEVRVGAGIFSWIHPNTEVTHNVRLAGPPVVSRMSIKKNSSPGRWQAVFAFVEV